MKKESFVGFVAVFVVGVMLIAGAFCFDADAFWITDGGNKYMVGRTFMELGTTSLTMGADNQFFPTGGFHFIAHNGQYKSVFPDYYAVITAPFGEIAGGYGLLVLQLICGVGLLALFFLFCRYFKWSSWGIAWGVFALAFATPIAFYCWTYWEMVPSVAIMLGGLYLALCRDVSWFKIGLILGLSLFVRSEFYFVIGAMVLTFLSFKEWRNVLAICLGFLLSGMLIWGYQYMEYGDILGFHGATYHTHNAEHLSLWVRGVQQFKNYYYYLFSFRGVTYPLLLVVFAVSLGVGAWSKRFIDGLKIKTILGVCGAFLWQVLAFSYWRAEEPVLQSIFMVGLFSSLPFLLIYLLNWRALCWCKSKKIAFLSRLFLLYSLIVPPLLTANDLGIIWGARHWMVLLPVMVFLSGYAAWRMRLLWLFLVLGFLSLEIQLGGWRALAIMTENSAKLSSEIDAKSGDIIISDIYFLPEQTPKLYFKKRWLYLDRDSKMELFLAQEQLPKQLTLVVSQESRYRKLSNEALGKLMSCYQITSPPELVNLSGSSFLNVAIFNLKLKR